MAAVGVRVMQVRIGRLSLSLGSDTSLEKGLNVLINCFSSCCYSRAACRARYVSHEENLTLIWSVVIRQTRGV